jgi:hypothetical protein
MKLYSVKLHLLKMHSTRSPCMYHITQFAGEQLVRQQENPIQEEHRQGSGRGQHVRRQGCRRRCRRKSGRRVTLGRITLPWGRVQ